MAEMAGRTAVQNNAETGRFLTFLLDREEYGIDIGRVKEIIVIGTQTITALPELPTYMLGIINLRGNIIPVMDVRLRFKKPAKEFDDRTCVVVVEMQNTLLGLIVDEVSEVQSIEVQDIVPVPDINLEHKHNFVKAVGKTSGGTKLLLECDNLLKAEELLEITKAL